MAQHRNCSDQDSAVHFSLKEKNISFQDNNVNILAREDRRFERGYKNPFMSTSKGRLWTEEAAKDFTYHQRW